MKRRLTLTILTLVFILVLGTLCEIGSSRIAHRYQRALLHAGAALSEKNWDRALSLVNDLALQWDHESGFVQLWINHADVDDVTQGLIYLQAAIISQDSFAALLYYGECMENFGHLHHRDAFTLKNIL